jgi:hypothetical protein
MYLLPGAIPSDNVVVVPRARIHHSGSGTYPAMP